MATFQEATALYERAITGMQEALDRLEAIDALPWWERSRERRRLNRIFYAFEHQAQKLGDAIDEGLAATAGEE